MGKVLVAHAYTQHSFRVVTALKKHDMLFKYVTSVYNKDNSFLYRLITIFLSKSNKNRALKKKCSAISDNEVITMCSLLGLIALLLIRIDMKIWEKYTHFFSKVFQKKLARYIIKHQSEIDMVISYDLHSYYLFEEIKRKAPQIICVMDNAHPCRYYLHKVYNDIDSGPFYKTLGLEANGYIVNKDVAKHWGEELLKAQYHIVASSFSKKAAMYGGVPEDNIYVVPYGANKSIFTKNPNKNYNGTLKVLFVGSIHQRKGIYNILEAAKILNETGKKVEFNLVGVGYANYPELYDPYKKYVNFCGYVSLEELVDLYANSHLFVFPTLGEGYGLVLLEAMSAGLPILATPNCGAADIIIENYNGILLQPGITNDLVNKINSLDMNRDRLKLLSLNAETSTCSFTWERYESLLIDAINDIFIKENKQV